MEEGDGSNSPAIPEDSQRNELTEGLAENVVVFQQCVAEVVAAVDRDANFNEMTAESYDKKKAYMKEHLQELSNIHNSLADQYADLIEEISMNRQSQIQNQHLQSSESSSSPQVSQILGPKASTTTSFSVLLHPDGGGFYLVKSKGPSHSGLESSVPPVNVAALKVKETKDPGYGGSDSGSESSMSSVNKPPLPPVNDDALKVEDTNEALHEKISSLEDEVGSLKQKVQSLTVENGELKQEIEGNITDIRAYMADSKLEIKAMEEELNASKEFAKKIDEQMCKILEEKISNLAKHESELIEMKKKMTECANEMLQMESTHEKKEKIWNGVTEHLKNDLKEKNELVEELSKNVEDLLLDKSAQNNLIHKLETDLNSAKFENAGLLPPLDNVKKLTDELKLKVEELEREVDKQREAMSDGDRK